ncbi:hypothetical protein DFH09DRAFT_1283537 [Mycena vulgaris]|nr:hypothetical protein DFH09DRAFT_1283537 [Mycena vulgaris]
MAFDSQNGMAFYGQNGMAFNSLVAQKPFNGEWLPKMAISEQPSLDFLNFQHPKLMFSEASLGPPGDVVEAGGNIDYDCEKEEGYVIAKYYRSAREGTMEGGAKPQNPNSEVRERIKIKVKGDLMPPEDIKEVEAGKIFTIADRPFTILHRQCRGQYLLPLSMIPPHFFLQTHAAGPTTPDSSPDHLLYLDYIVHKLQHLKKTNIAPSAALTDSLRTLDNSLNAVVGDQLVLPKAKNVVAPNAGTGWAVTNASMGLSSQLKVIAAPKKGPKKRVVCRRSRQWEEGLARCPHPEKPSTLGTRRVVVGLDARGPGLTTFARSFTNEKKKKVNVPAHAHHKDDRHAMVERPIARASLLGAADHYQKSKDICTSRRPALVPNNGRAPSALKDPQETLCSAPLRGATPGWPGPPPRGGGALGDEDGGGVEEEEGDLRGPNHRGEGGGGAREMRRVRTSAGRWPSAATPRRPPAAGRYAPRLGVGGAQRTEGGDERGRRGRRRYEGQAARWVFCSAYSKRADSLERVVEIIGGGDVVFGVGVNWRSKAGGDLMPTVHGTAEQEARGMAPISREASVSFYEAMLPENTHILEDMLESPKKEDWINFSVHGVVKWSQPKVQQGADNRSTGSVTRSEHSEETNREGRDLEILGGRLSREDRTIQIFGRGSFALLSLRLPPLHVRLAIPPSVTCLSQLGASNAAPAVWYLVPPPRQLWNLVLIEHAINDVCVDSVILAVLRAVSEAMSRALPMAPVNVTISNHVPFNSPRTTGFLLSAFHAPRGEAEHIRMNYDGFTPVGQVYGLARSGGRDVLYIRSAALQNTTRYYRAANPNPRNTTEHYTALQSTCPTTRHYRVPLQGAVGACLQDKQRDPDPLDIGDTLIPDPGPQYSDDADVPGNLGPADDLWDYPELKALPVSEQPLPHWQRSPEETKLLELIALYRTMFPPLLLDEFQPVLPAPRSLYCHPHFYN